MSDWINWEGGECPVHPKDVVQVSLGGDDCRRSLIGGDINWKAHLGAATVMRYRITEPFIPDEHLIDITPTQEDKNKLYGSTREEIKPEDMLNAKAEHTGLSVGYYSVVITTWTNPKYQQPEPVVIECNDIIEALNMNYACGNVFKAIWRICAAAQGKLKKGNDTIYDAEKAVFFSNRIHEQHTNQ